MSFNKDRIKSIIERHNEREAKKLMPRKKYDHPEKRVEKDVLKWASKNGFDLTVVDSKKLFTENGHATTATSESVVDLLGDLPNGTACYIELKSEKNKTRISYYQYKFLERKIKRGCFGACVHNAERLELIYHTWLGMLGSDHADPLKFLLDQLPTNKSVRQRLAEEAEPLF